MLLADATRRLFPSRPAGLATRIGRVFTHGDMKAACRSIMDRKLSRALAEFAPRGFSADLTLVASAFVELQEARHSADYDIGVHLSRTEALDHVQQAFDAFAAWKRVRRSDEATAFLAALLFAPRWSK